MSNDAVEQSEAHATEARRAANDADETYQTQHGTFQDLQTQAGGLSLEEATELVTAAEEAVASAKTQVTELTDLRARINANESKSEQLREETSAAKDRKSVV